MHIEAELDENHAQRLIALQQRLQKPLPEVLAMLIDLASEQTNENFIALPEPISIVQWPGINLSREFMYGDDGR